MQLKKLIEQRNRSKSTKELADLTLEIAVLHTESGDHAQALSEYTRLLELWQTKGDKLQCAITHRFIADCCIELGEYDQAINHTNHYLKLATDLGNKLEQQRAFVTLGRCFLNRAETMRDGDTVRKNLVSAAQALLNSIRMIGDLGCDLDAKQLGEMRAVSLLNLGQVFRAQRERSAALERFTQCISLSRKYQLQKLFFRACYQIADLSVNTPPGHSYEPVNRSSLIAMLNSTSLRNVVTILSMALVSPMATTNVDHEAKELLRNLRESLAQIYLAVGQFRKAAKVYRLLKLHNPNSSDFCRQYIRKCMLLSNLMHLLPETIPQSLDSHVSALRTHERMGDIYSGLEMYGTALRHYKFMLTHAEKAYDLRSINDTSAVDLSKHVDAALVSVAETYRALGEYDCCVDTYRREIHWVTSTSVPNADLAGSWFSLAQAQRLTCAPSDTDDQIPSVLPGSVCTVESLNFALQAAQSSGNVSLVTEIIRELIDYHKQHHNTEPVLRLEQELATYEPNGRSHHPRSSSSEEELSGEEETGDTAASVHSSDDLDDDAVTQFTEALSSDSEVERCVGQTEVLDEFHDARRGKRQGKALCLKTNMKGETPLHVAAINGDMDHVIKLIEVLGHPVNVTDGAGWLPIHEAAFHDRTEVAIYLLDHGARLDDPGCPLDMSTPLFEAIHNGSLATALVLIQRGADLWHRNKQGECLPHLLDSWEPVRRSSSTFAQQRALFDQLLNAIKGRLGADYDRWCHLRRASSSGATANDVSTCSTPTTSPKTPQCSTRTRPSRFTPSQRRRRYTRSPSLSDQEDSPNRSRLPNLHRRSSRRLRGQDWDELLVDLDEDAPSQKENVTTTNRKSHDQAVKSYREAIQAVGGSSASRPNKRHQKDSGEDATRSKRRSTQIIDADDDSWLVNDEAASDSRPGAKCPMTVRDPLDKVGLRQSERKRTDTQRGRRSVEKLRDLSHLGNIPETEFHPADFLSSTQITLTKQSSDNVERPKTVPAPPPTNGPQSKPVPAKDAPTPSSSAGKDRKGSTSSVADLVPSSTGTPQPPPPPASQPIMGRAITGVRGSCCSVKVAFADISVLVPVDDSSRSVAWLADEAYRRREILTGNRTATSFNPLAQAGTADLVRLSTRDGALLLPTDRLHSVLPALNHVSGSVIELLAELTLPQSSIPVETAGFMQNQNMQPVTGAIQPIGKIKPIQRIPQSTTTSHVKDKSEKLDQLVQSSFFKVVLERARRTGVVDLCYLALGDKDCSAVCEHLLSHGQLRTITELRFSGNCLTGFPDDSSGASGLLTVLVQMAAHLTRLDFEANFLRIPHLLHLFDALGQRLHPGAAASRGASVLLPRLQYLNLSHNVLTGTNTIPWTETDARYMTGAPETSKLISWTELITKFITAFPKLAQLHLVGCSLDSDCGMESPNPPELQSLPKPTSITSPISALSELDLSWNYQLSAHSLASVLSNPALAGLRSLRLRGCSTSTSNVLPVPTSLPLEQDVLTTCAWFPVKPDFIISPKPIGFHMSGGDQLLRVLTKAMSEGHFRLQLLDLGYCQLSMHCLSDLRSLFGTPGTSLTTVQLDHNPNLFTSQLDSRGPHDNGWVGVLQATAQTASAVVSLTIDMPKVDGDDDALTACLGAVEAKLLAGLSSTPLQELILVGVPDDCHAADGVQQQQLYQSEDEVWSSSSWVPGSTNSLRLCQHLSTLFRSRFGQLARVRRLARGRLCFGIV